MMYLSISAPRWATWSPLRRLGPTAARFRPFGWLAKVVGYSRRWTAEGETVDELMQDISRIAPSAKVTPTADGFVLTFPADAVYTIAGRE